ncbi:MAG TPA: hypothetical protein DDX54_05850 [Rhodospirillaceae bacterium]|jgi:hypothetical protein|nr:hypothetical protein [Alphaproteobacteria bacterium]HBH26907.1 hypothetical protein [Rhodospirillaceae bacterium]
MQDHYVADIGDYIKYALLRALAPAAPGPLGVAWYVGPGGDTHNGEHRAYLDKPGDWRRYDPALFDALRALPERSIRAVERSGILPTGTVFAGEPLPADKDERTACCGRVQEAFEACGWVFADPDVGLAGKTALATRSQKHVPLDEALALAAGRPMVVYHHNGQHKPHPAQIKDWLAQMSPDSRALYARPWKPRTFFLLNMTPGIATAVHAFAALWKDKVDWVAPCTSAS